VFQKTLQVTNHGSMLMSLWGRVKSYEKCWWKKHFEANGPLFLRYLLKHFFRTLFTILHVACFLAMYGYIKGYIRFVEKYVTGRRKRSCPYTVYIFLTRIISVQQSVCPYERCDLGNYKSFNTGIGIQILEIAAQRMSMA